MSQTSARFSLPYIQPSQAQKHVTHNEALRVLDSVVQLVLQDAGLNTPPPAPQVGAAYGVGGTPNQAWVSFENTLAVWTGSLWEHVQPQVGWTAWNIAEDAQQRFTGTDWVAVGAAPSSTDTLGVNTSADLTNRLAVASDATLFSHDGTGHQLKLNKATDGDTASLLFQSNFVGHAEMGLAGTTDFEIKVSDDGSNWFTPLTTAGDGSDISLTATELTLNGALTGTAVQSGAADGTAGRALLAGTSVLAPGATDLGDPIDGISGTRLGGFNSVDNGAYDLTDNGSERFGVMIQVERATGRRHRIFHTITGQMFHQHETSGGMEPARRVIDSGNMLGTVDLDSGDPTGGVIETGSTANGTYTKFADGTQICWTPVDTVDATTVTGALYSGDATVRTFAAPFIAAPVVSVSPVTGGAGIWATPKDVTATTFIAHALSAASTTGIDVQAVAIGRWA